MVRISVITIAKNNAPTIEQVVKNALQIGDESIVVDTGSSDETLSLAKRAGARVIEYPMEEFDYSTPRNRGSEAARNKWVLHLDTDEMIPPFYRGRIQKKIRESQIRVLTLVQQGFFNRSIIPKERSGQPRLFDKEKYHYEGLVYEWVYPSCSPEIADVIIQHQPLEGINKTELRIALTKREIGILQKTPFPTGIDELTQRISRGRHLYFHDKESTKAALQKIVMKAYQAACRVDPFDETVNIEMSRAFYDLFGSPDLAYATIKSIPASKQISTEYWRDLTLLQSIYEPREGIESAKRLLSFGATSDAWFVAVMAYLGANQIPNALHALKQANEILPEDGLYQELTERIISRITGDTITSLFRNI